LQLLQALENIGGRDPDLYDTQTREAMFDVVYAGFLKPRDDFELALDYDFAMQSKADNRAIRRALNKFITAAQRQATKIGLSTPNERLAAFYSEVSTDGGRCVDDFFGWIESID
jgi:hypothetical protein